MAPILYLKAYNFSMILGWSFILAIYFIKGFSTGFDAEKMYQSMAIPLAIFQYGAVLEIFHSIFKWVKSPLMTTVTQVFSRVVLVFVLEFVPESRKFGLILLGFAWSLTEVIRYSFYFIKLMGFQTPYALLWCRYSFFIFLYPMGVSGEVITLCYTLVKYRTNIIVVVVLVALILYYIPGLKTLYTYMLKQRRSVLGSGNQNVPVKKEEKKTN